MIRNLLPIFLSCALLVLCTTRQSYANEPDRSVLAMIMPSGQIYLGWRLFSADPDDVGFNIYRKLGEDGMPELRNASPITYTTNYIDSVPPAGTNPYYYYVVPVIDGVEGSPSAQTAIMDNGGLPYFEFEMETPADFMHTGVGDLDGDGLNDYLVQLPKKFIDPYCPNWNSSGGSTFKIHAYNHYGEFMWSFDRGVDIEMGTWYSPLITYDFDGDGKAEVALKGGEGDHRDSNGRVNSGPEYLYILDGETGALLAQDDWPSRDRFLTEVESCEVGTNYEGYNRASRNLMSIAYLDGETPFIITSRGTYGYQVTKAFKYENNSLYLEWEWDNASLDASWQGQGAHFQHGADVDGDGKDEVVLGASVIDNDGTPLWTLDIGHVDHAYVADILPSHPGLEMYYGAEYFKEENGLGLVDAATGTRIWGVDFEINHAHREGMVADIDPNSPGLEVYSQSRDNGGMKYLHSADGQLLSNIELGENPKPLYWDEDIYKEFIYNGNINKYTSNSYTPILPFEGRIVAIADILGDWREEVVTAYQGKIRIYSTITPTNQMFNWLMEDRLYRTDVAAQSMGYFQTPMSSTNLQDDTRLDCNGVAGGDAFIDKCGTCVGGNTGVTACPMDCNGEIGGGAYYDNCGVCVEGSTGITACVELQEGQAERKCAGFSAITSEYSGYTGSGYVRQSNSTSGGDIVWGFNSAVAQMVDIYITYSFGSGSGRTVEILVDEEVQGSHTFQPTEDWYTWKVDTVSVYFPAGITSFKLATSEKLPNVDKIEWRSDDLILADCDERVTDCDGVWGGTAYKDDCEGCVGGLTGETPCVATIMEAEDHYCELDGVVQNSFEGAYGDGYVNTNNAVGESVSWVLEAENAVSIELIVRYASGASTIRDADVFVNGELQAGGVSFPNSGGYDVWKGYSLNLNLQAGPNEVLISSLSSGGLVLIDRLIWEDTSVVPGNCSDIADIILEDCNGTAGGSAYISCGVCVGGTTGLESSCSELEAEDHYCELDGVVQTSQTGYSGTGFVNTDDAVGNVFSFSLNSETAQDLILSLTYSNDDPGRTMDIIVNGVKQVSSVDPPGTGNWSTWSTMDIEISLLEGDNLIELRSLTNDGLVLIDKVSWGASGITVGNCDGNSILDCNGTAGGSAYISCGVCVGGTTGLESSCSELEAEDHYCELDGVVQTSQTGYSGTGFVNTDDAVGNVFSFSLNSETAQDLVLSLTYSNDDPGRTMDIIVNGVKQVSSVDPPGTGSWSTWSTMDIGISLLEGENYIVFSSLTGGGLVLIDKVGWGASGVTVGNCGVDCDGVKDGSAYIDDCDVCVGGTTGLDPCSELQAEDFCSFDGIVETRFTGYTGTGIINSDDFIGATGTWAFESSSAQSTVLKVRYSNDDGSGRPVDVYVNGELQTSGYSFPQTGGWSSWSEIDLNIDFNEGINFVDLIATKSGGLALIDKFTWSNSSISIGDCDADLSKEIFEIEAEDHYCQLDGEVESVFSNYSGNGYINTHNSSGASYSFALHSSIDQIIDMTVTFSNGEKGGLRPIRIYVNDSLQSANNLFPVTESWSDWDTLSVKVILEEGNNIIKFYPNAGSGLVLIDKIEWKEANISLGTCNTDFAVPNHLNNSANFHKSHDDLASFEDRISIHPNPIGNSFTIENISDGKVFLFNTLGNKMDVSIEVEGSNMKVNTEFLPSGSYLLQIHRGTGIKYFKLIK